MDNNQEKRRVAQRESIGKVWHYGMTFWKIMLALLVIFIIVQMMRGKISFSNIM